MLQGLANVFRLRTACIFLHKLCRSVRRKIGSDPLNVLKVTIAQTVQWNSSEFPVFLQQLHFVAVNDSQSSLNGVGPGIVDPCFELCTIEL